MYLEGVGVAKDDAEGLEWLKQSAEQGYAVAQDDLGVGYGDGKYGLTQNWKESYRWINRAAQQGYPQALQDLKFVIPHMTPQELQPDH